jgi:hypothetical protein
VRFRIDRRTWCSYGGESELTDVRLQMSRYLVAPVTVVRFSRLAGGWVRFHLKHRMCNVGYTQNPVSLSFRRFRI